MTKDQKEQFTPGPWHAGGNCVNRYVWSIDRDHPVDRGEYTTDFRRIARVFGSKRIGASNAALIAAAPDLYAALAQAVEKYGKPGGPWNVPSEPGSWIEKAKQALKKARGE